MNKFVLLLLLVSAQSFAHFMWVETSPMGKLNQKQEVKVYFGEYSYGVFEKVNEDAFNKMKDFELWVVSPSGKKTTITVTPGDTFYSGWFTPTEKGTYTVTLNNNKIDVIDYTQYNFGIFKTHYHAVAKTQVGDNAKQTIAANADGLALVDMSTSPYKQNGEAVIKVLYKGQPIAEAEVAVFVGDQWTKTLHSDKDGIIKFSMPWKTKYVLEVTKKEEVPGKYNGKDYQFIFHSATYNIPL